MGRSCNARGNLTDTPKYSRKLRYVCRDASYQEPPQQRVIASRKNTHRPFASSDSLRLVSVADSSADRGEQTGIRLKGLFFYLCELRLMLACFVADVRGKMEMSISSIASTRPAL